MYDHVINTLILLVDIGILYVVWQSENRKAKARMTRRFNRILQSIGLK